jgi:hypothetical protein
MPVARGDEQVDNGEEDLILKHEHVELDLIGVLLHGHVKYSRLMDAARDALPASSPTRDTLPASSPTPV